MQRRNTKLSGRDELDRRERLGITGPEPIPHPDDIQVNFVTAEVRFTGPMTRREKAEWDHLYDRVEEADRKIESLTIPLEKIRSKIVRDMAKQKSPMSEAFVMKLSAKSVSRANKGEVEAHAG